MEELEITITVKLRKMPDCKTPIAVAIESMNDAATDWREGRYPFHIEMITNAVSRMMGDGYYVNDELTFKAS